MPLDETSYYRPGMTDEERVGSRLQFVADRLQLEATLLRERERDAERRDALTMLVASAEECSIRAATYLDLLRRRPHGLG